MGSQVKQETPKFNDGPVSHTNPYTKNEFASAYVPLRHKLSGSVSQNHMPLNN